MPITKSVARRSTSRTYVGLGSRGARAPAWRAGLFVGWPSSAGRRLLAARDDHELRLAKHERKPTLMSELSQARRAYRRACAAYELALRVSAPFGHVLCEVGLLARDEAEAVLRAACWAQVHASPQWQDRARGPALAFVGASLGVMSRLAPGR